MTHTLLATCILLSQEKFRSHSVTTAFQGLQRAGRNCQTASESPRWLMWGFPKCSVATEFPCHFHTCQGAALRTPATFCSGSQVFRAAVFCLLVARNLKLVPSLWLHTHKDLIPMINLKFKMPPVICFPDLAGLGSQLCTNRSHYSSRRKRCRWFWNFL